jgi:hypothetical protein
VIAPAGSPERDNPRTDRLRRLFLHGFSVLDVAEALCSFDAERPAWAVREFLEERDFDLVGVRRQGLVAGYAVREELFDGTLGDYRHDFVADDLVTDGASLAETIRSLDVNGRCFVSRLGQVDSVVTFGDLEKPPVRMWLFGMVTMLEMAISRQLRTEYEGESWGEALTPERLGRARELRDERHRRGREGDLLDCVQFADKATILLKKKGRAEALGFASRRKAGEAFAALQSLRNSLAHTQEIISTDWRAVVKLSSSLELLLSAF